MNKKQIQKIGTTQIALLASIALVASVMLLMGVRAADVPVGAELGDPDCYWSDGPDSELYVYNHTCTIDADTTAKNLTGWTDYAVIVYPGATLEIVGNPANTTLTVDGDMYIMGTVNIGDGTAGALNNNITTTNNLGNGDIYVMSSGILNVNENTGAGENVFNVVNNMYIGDSGDPSAATLDLHDDSTGNWVENMLRSYDDVNLDDGRLSVGSLNMQRPSSGSQTSTFDIANGATLDVRLYHTCNTYLCAIEVGYNHGGSESGDAILSVYGDLNVLANAADRSIFIGNDGFDASLVISTTGQMDVDEATASFGGPGPFDDPSNYFGVLSDGAYGLEVQGLLNTGMFLRNFKGAIRVISPSNTGKLYAEQGYQQASSLSIDADDTMKITGEADIDGDSDVYGTLEVTQCMRVTNDSGEAFNTYSAANIDLNTDDDTTCALSGSSDGLFIEGTDTEFAVADGASHDFDVWQDITADDGALVDFNGEFTGNDRLYVLGDDTKFNLSDSGTDTATAQSMTIAPNVASPSAPPILTIESSGTLYLDEGSVNIGGAVATTETGLVDVYGTLNINPAASSSGFDITRYGRLLIQSTGEVNADGNTCGGCYFTVGGGELDVYGDLNFNGTGDMEMWIYSSTDDPRVHVYNGGTIDSKSTTISRGLNYDAGELTIDSGGQMLFDDEIDIDTPSGDVMTISGLLEGTGVIDYTSANSSNYVRASGEMRVIGTDSVIELRNDLGVTGKINGFNGAGDINIYNGADNGGPGTGGDDSYTYFLARDLTINTGGSINVNDFSNCVGGGTWGGSYGGEGLSSTGPVNSTYGAVKYTTAPVYSGTANPVGMCGRTSGGGSNVNGGGAAYIEVHRDININGPITANGADSIASNAGAGSGGLIVINHNIDHSDTVADFTGSANIEANGGNGSLGNNAMGGGGGRIVIDSILFEQPDDTESAEPHYKYTGGIYTDGGSSTDGTGAASDYAAAGTFVFLSDDNSPNGTLVVNQGNRSLGTLAAETNITTTGSYVFDRVEAKEGADITFDSTPGTMPISCFKDGTSSYNLGAACALTHDKPDTLHINAGYPGAQTGDEPWWDFNSPDGVKVKDLTPEFSFVYRNPEDGSQNGEYALIEVNTDSGFGAGTSVWDATDANNPIDITDVGETGRTEDITYAGDTLSINTTYYVRAAFSDATGATRGLWTHKDMANHYKFSTDSTYMEISNGCSDTIDVETSTGGALKNAAGSMYGDGSCTFTVTSTDTAWKVYYHKAAPGLSLNDGTGTYVWDEIDNSTPTFDCTMDTTGNTLEEEYGFNITNLTNFTSPNIYANSDCRRDTATYPDACGNGAGEGYYNDTDCMFNIDDYASPATSQLLDANGNTVTGGTFDLVIHANIDGSTEVETYELNTTMILTDTP